MEKEESTKRLRESEARLAESKDFYLQAQSLKKHYDSECLKWQEDLDRFSRESKEMKQQKEEVLRKSQSFESTLAGSNSIHKAEIEALKERVRSKDSEIDNLKSKYEKEINLSA